MDFGAHSVYAALLGIFEKVRDQTAADALPSPLRHDKERHDVHRFAAEFCTPLVGAVGVTAKSPFAILRNDDKAAVGSGDDVLENSPGILDCALGANIGEKLPRQITQLVYILGTGRSNLKKLRAHRAYPGTHPVIVIPIPNFENSIPAL